MSRLTLQQICTWIRTHADTKEKLDEINEAVRYQRELQTSLKAESFRIGDKVQFTASYGRLLKGTVTKVNWKTVKVHVPVGVHGTPQSWKVAATLLEKAGA